MWDTIALILCGSIVFIIIGGAVLINIMGYFEGIKDQGEYNKSLFNYLHDVKDEMRRFHGHKKENFNEIEREFYDISEKILNFDNSFPSFDKETIDNMRLFNSMAYHELNALKMVRKSLGIGVPPTDENIQNALFEITKGLKEHYAKFCDIKTAGVKEEIDILKKLQEKKAERMLFDSSK